MDHKSEKRRKRALKRETSNIICQPLNDSKEIENFLEDPPPWRTLCIDLVPRSKHVLRNMDSITGDESWHEITDFLIQNAPMTRNYCHFPPSANMPNRYDTTKERIPKTLVCHDMANGYHDDSVMGGTTNYSQYTFYNWAGIDIFCYFSHHLITIPPLAWINVGHAHGVKVIGTIISEWADGALFWEKVLSSTIEYQNFASAVVAIAKTMKFDGYLLNIENKITEPDMLLEFVKHLHETLHRELPDPVLIWYDSVTIKGKLSWQNELNEKNIDFFNACDGFFTNYSWSVQHVQRSAKMAGERLTDLYIGIDVWGRNFYGGGQFNTQEAVQVAHQEGCSLAIFAPAWTHESMAPASERADLNYIVDADTLNGLERFTLRDRALWGSLWPYLYTHVPCHLPFHTSFCRGQGMKRWRYGEVISPGPWYNPLHQQYQPNAAHGQHGYKLSLAKSLPKAVKTVSTPSDHGAGKGIIKFKENQDSAPEDPSQKVEQPKPRSEVEQPSRTSFDISGNVPPVASTPNAPKKTFSYRFKRFIERITFNTIKLGARKDPAAKNTNSDPGSPSKDTSPSPDTTTGGAVTTHVAVQPTSAISTEPVLTHNTSRTDTIPTSAAGAPGDKVTAAGTSSPPSRERSLADADLPGHADNADETTLGRENSISLSKLQQSMMTMSTNLHLQAQHSKQRWVLTFKPMEKECLQVYLKDAFNGGSCLRINPSDIVSRDHRLTRLFHCEFECAKKMIICVVTKPLHHYGDQSLNVQLTMLNQKGHEQEVILLGRNLQKHSYVHPDSSGLTCVYPIYSPEQDEFKELRRYLLVNQPDFYVPIENHFGWEVRYYTLEVAGSRIFEINCRTVLPQGGILLGHLGITTIH